MDIISILYYILLPIFTYLQLKKLILIQEKTKMEKKNKYDNIKNGQEKKY